MADSPQTNFIYPPAEFDLYRSRSESYTLAHEENPEARNAELHETLNLIGDQIGNTIMEIGAGQGFLTSRLLGLVGSKGTIIAVDNSEQQLAALRKLLPDIRCVLASSESVPIANNSADIIVSLANFHHIANKNLAFQECARILKPDGILIIADVSAGTRVQKYFDEVVDRICSTGHKHKFLDEDTCRNHCALTDLEVLSWQMKSVPWRFSSDQEAGLFLKLIHDASSSPEECWRAADTYLGSSKADDNCVLLHWELFFMTARKGN
jgi:SAM-dependent methyltransferase